MIINFLKNISEFKEITNSVDEQSTPILASGFMPVHSAHFISGLYKKYKKQIVVICPNEDYSTKIISDLENLLHENVVNLPTREINFHNIDNSSREWEHRRIKALYSMMKEKKIIVTTPDALMIKTMSKKTFSDSSLFLEKDKSYNTDEICKKLINLGYKRFMQIEGVGQFSLRGGILDVFSPAIDKPVRIEFFGDIIDTMATFDKDSQRRSDEISNIICLPNNESCNIDMDKVSEILQKTKNPDLLAILSRDIEKYQTSNITSDRYIPISHTASAIDYINGMVIFCESSNIEKQIDIFENKITSDVEILLERNVLSKENTEFIINKNEFFSKVSPICIFNNFIAKSEFIKPKEIISITAKSINIDTNNIIAESLEYLKQNFKTVILSSSDIKRKNFASENEHIKINDSLPKNGQCHIMHGSLSSSIEYPNYNIAILNEGIYQKARKKIVKNKNSIKSFTDLTIGDLVVHEHHGISKFIAIERISTDGNTRDYIKLAFAGSDCLYVPATSLNLVSKYIGKESIRLNSLNSNVWQATKTRAKISAKDLAHELIKLYAIRNKLKGFCFPKDDDIQNDFENRFIYEETDDQLKSISDIKKDMESDMPMDRLLCGDVGFGKTEVALRAVMKCILGGKQAAILVPTTVLARQHYLTALSRFNGLPVRIDMLSRFKTNSEQKKILEKLEKGELDLIIGTHKLFLKTIKFKDLGLLVIDEEQRFGVSHKEKLKELCKNIDVLTLSATPIPRTLNMALSGVRDMSMLEEAPLDRYPVQTYVMEYDEFMIHDAIRREKSRNGQCFYIHNNTESIYTVATKLRKVFPEYSISVAHGKMSQKELSIIMEKMTNGEIDVLLCTTIIETGIDIPNANTLIIEDSDKMGLSQLHQLRGRVGRSNRHSYAYFTYRHGKILTDVSIKRLSAIREYTEFGSGFKIAMRDLSIRGAGNILGGEQSGHLMNIGYDLYLKILEDAVLEEKGEEIVINCTIDINISCNIPEDYISDIGSRIDLYRRIAQITKKSDFEDIVDEIIDRFGDMPKSVYNLCRIAYIKGLASSKYITNIEFKSGVLTITWGVLDLFSLSALCSEYKGRAVLTPSENPYITMRINSCENVLTVSENLLNRYACN